MGSVICLFDCKSDNALLSGGDWQASLPLENMQNDKMAKVARSTDTSLLSTQFTIELPVIDTFETVAFGPTNLQNGSKIKLTKYSDATFTTEVMTTGWTVLGARAPWGSLPYGSPSWYTGYAPWPDSSRGIVAFVELGSPIAGRFWKVEIDDQTNPDGFVDIGKLFMARQWTPSLNYTYAGNGLGVRDNSLRSQNLAGGQAVYGRKNPRQFQIDFDHLPEAEAFGIAATFEAISGFNKPVLIIPDPDDKTHVQARVFFSRIVTPSPLQQASFAHASRGYMVEEII